jgi:SpoIID/LytB domain protein
MPIACCRANPCIDARPVASCTEPVAAQPDVVAEGLPAGARRTRCSRSRAARRLAAPLVVALALGAAQRTSPPSVAPAHAAGAAASTAAAPGRWYFVGHGAGSGSGLGQWGALGDAVRFHWGYRRLLAHFYGGTRAGELASSGYDADPWISVLVLQNLDLRDNRGSDPLVTSSGPMLVESSDAPPPVAPRVAATAATAAGIAVPAAGGAGRPPATAGGGGGAPGFEVPAGEAVDLRLSRSGTWDAYEGPSCAAALAAARRHAAPAARGLTDPAVLPTTAPAAPGGEGGTGGSGGEGSTGGEGGTGGALVLCPHGGGTIVVDGAVEAYDRSGYERTLAVVPLEDYVAAVTGAEMPGWWASLGAAGPGGRPLGFQALEAQAVAVRSFAVASGLAGGWNGYATTCDSTLCQVYAGSGAIAPADVAAAAATAGQVRMRGDAVASTTYSASSGGYTAPGAYPAVVDLGDACFDPGDPPACNPVHTWHASVRTAALSSALGDLGTLQRLVVDQRDGDGAFGGRVLELTVVGSAGTRTLDGNSFAAAAGLPSDWFVRVRAPAGTSSPVQPSSSVRVAGIPLLPSAAARTASTWWMLVRFASKLSADAAM